MGSFIDSLAKGFVRSAVNQVGRDAGKVVSNGVYGDAHSTPYRRVNGSSNGSSYNRQAEEFDGGCDSSALQIIEPTSTGKAILYSVVGIIFNVVGFFFLVYNGYSKIKNAGRVTAYRYETRNVYVEDRRYKTGSRLDHKETSRRKVYQQASEDEEAQNRLVGKIYLYTAFIMIVLYVCVMVINVTN